MQSLSMKSRAKRINGNTLSAKLQKASRLFEKGKLTNAKRNYLQVLKHDPTNADLLQILGLIENELGNYDRAERYLRGAINSDPKCVSRYIHIGQFYIDQHQPEKALGFLNESIAAGGDIPDLFCLAGDAHMLLQSPKEAMRWYLKAINRAPEHLLAYTKLASCYRSLNMFDKAFKCYQKALHISPNNVTALHNLGHIYKKMGALNEAIEYYRKALANDPECADIYISLGDTLRLQRRFAAAHEMHEKALRLAPDNHLVHYHIGLNLIEQGLIAESKPRLKQALALNPDFKPAKIHYLLSLPIVYANQNEIIGYRKEYEKGIDALIADWELSRLHDPRLHLEGLTAWNNFYLPYQGDNVLRSQEKTGGYFESVMRANYPDKSTTRKTISLGNRKKIRVGYVSESMFNHTVGKLFIGWVEQADPSVFDIYCYHTHPRVDQMTERYKAAHCTFRQNSIGIESVAEQIIADDIDILVYLDIGMANSSQMLSALRLAPVQCVTWGHPVTTGLPSMDYFLSSDLMEPPNGQDHYSETLIRLPNLSIFYQQPDLPFNTQKRDAFGLKDNDFVYFASQSLFKYLPEDDAIYANIASAVPQSKFVFLENESRQVTTSVKHRLQLAFKKAGLDYEAFCIFQPRLAYPDFINLNYLSDVLLDPPAWSGGMTSLEGISCGLPIVTLPGNLMRSRHTYAILKFAGIQATIAKNKKDYEHIAIRLGTDAAFHAACKTTVQNNIHRLYGDRQAIDGLESFYKSVVVSD